MGLWFYFRNGSAEEKSDSTAVICGKNFNKNLIVFLYQIRHCPEVGREGDKVRAAVLCAISSRGFDAREELGVGVAEEVDGLHGVADDEAGAAGTFGPGAR